MRSDQLFSPRFNIPLVLLIVYFTVSACAHIPAASDRDNNRAEYVEAAKELRKSAEAGDASAQNRLGLLYYEGKGVPQSYRQAKEWFEKAAKQGRARAQVNLGTLYLYGKGAPQSDEMALFWFNQAAEQGDALAFAKRGLMSARGHGVSQELMTMAEEPGGFPESTTVAIKPPDPVKEVNASREPVASKPPEPVKEVNASPEPAIVASKPPEPVKEVNASPDGDSGQ
jgi:TPR repeat protein